MKRTGLRCLSLCLGAGVVGASLAAADTGPSGSAAASGGSAAAPNAVRAQAREIFADIVGIESSIGKGKVPLVAKYLAERFKAGGVSAPPPPIPSLLETP